MTEIVDIESGLTLERAREIQAMTEDERATLAQPEQDAYERARDRRCLPSEEVMLDIFEDWWLRAYDHPPVPAETARTWKQLSQLAFAYACTAGIVSEEHGTLREIITRKQKHCWIWDMQDGRNILVPYTFLFSPQRFEEWFLRKHEEGPWEVRRPRLREWKTFLKKTFGVTFGKDK